MLADRETGLMTVLDVCRLWLSLEHRLLPQHHPASRSSESRGSPSRSSTGRIVSYGELAASNGVRQQPTEQQPVSAPMTPKSVEAAAKKLKPGRVGLVLDDNPIRISTVVPGSPADQTGQLKAGDHIIEVDGKPITEDMDLHEVSEMFNGPPDTTLDMVSSVDWRCAPWLLSTLTVGLGLQVVSRSKDSQDTQVLRRARIVRGAPEMGNAPQTDVYGDQYSATRELHPVSATLVRSPIPEHSSNDGTTQSTHFTAPVRNQDLSTPRAFTASNRPTQERPVLTRTPVAGPPREPIERPRAQRGTLESFIIRMLTERWKDMARVERRMSSLGRDGALDNEAFSPYGVQRVLLLCCNAAAKDTLLGAWGALQAQCDLLSLQSTNQDHWHFRQELEIRKMESEIKIRCVLACLFVFVFLSVSFSFSPFQGLRASSLLRF